MTLAGDLSRNLRRKKSLVEQNVQAVRQAVWLVSAKASPEDARAYQDMLMQVAERTAQAAKEGGFLGIGGEQVSDREREVLAELQSVIRGTVTTASTEPTSSALVTPSPDGSGNST